MATGGAGRQVARAPTATHLARLLIVINFGSRWGTSSESSNGSPGSCGPSMDAFSDDAPSPEDTTASDVADLVGKTNSVFRLSGTQICTAGCATTGAAAPETPGGFVIPSSTVTDCAMRTRGRSYMKHRQHPIMIKVPKTCEWVSAVAAKLDGSMSDIMPDTGRGPSTTHFRVPEPTPRRRGS
jgi:hypothetical protein